MNKLFIDKMELALAFEGNSIDSLYYLNLKDGSFKLVIGNESFYNEYLYEVEDEDDDNPEVIKDSEFSYDLWQQVPLEESWEAYSRMVAFTENLQQPRLKQKLIDALNRRKPFREFKDVLLNDTTVREEWFAFENTQREERILSWLEELESKFHLTIELR
jgi:hypothetical protein